MRSSNSGNILKDASGLQPFIEVEKGGISQLIPGEVTAGDDDLSPVGYSIDIRQAYVCYTLYFLGNPVDTGNSGDTQTDISIKSVLHGGGHSPCCFGAVGTVFFQYPRGKPP